MCHEMMPSAFDVAFKVLTCYPAMAWQKRLFHDYFLPARLSGALDIPTGLGKTNVIAVWLLALACQAAQERVTLPRRLIYVVNRRTVVDQATSVACAIRDALETFDARSVRDSLASLCRAADGPVLAISTLRGELADTREWLNDPAQPAIIVGTVDMIGSRLLFSGYGVSRKMRPFHAGLLGHDSLIVHDEAHLTPAFGALLREIGKVQKKWKESRGLCVLEMTATAHQNDAASKPFSLTESEAAESEVRRRIEAPKWLQIAHLPLELPPDKGKAAAAVSAARDAILAAALRLAGERRRVLVYVRAPEEARRIASELADKVGASRVAVLTGTIRGFERDKLVTENAVFQCFFSADQRPAPEATEYLVATSAGEVGIDLDADDLVCDLTPLESMIQRLGRVNRRGQSVATVRVIPWPVKPGDALDRLQATRTALESLPREGQGANASPLALRGLAGCRDAFSAQPRVAPLTNILLDAWAMTRLDNLPINEPVARWLHGIGGDPPDLYVAWRDEIPLIAELNPSDLARLFDNYDVHSREMLRGRLDLVLPEVKKLVKRFGCQVIVIPPKGRPSQTGLDKDGVPENSLIVLPTGAGGLDDHGMLDAGARHPVLDVADETGTVQRARFVVERDEETGWWSARRLGVDTIFEESSLVEINRVVYQELRRGGVVEKLRLVLKRDDEGGSPIKMLVLGMSARSGQAGEAALNRQTLDEHLNWTEQAASELLRRLSLSSGVADAIRVAARWHDRGKDRPGWQRAIGHTDNGPPWAKSDRRGFDAGALTYRHEFGSLREANADPEITNHQMRDLILHLIAAHHGWARPHFKPDHWDIADGVTEEESAVVSLDAMRRFARLQRELGYWQLAWFETLLRASDHIATRRL
jgi:CRISPR-associated endonuclease/helicase Cas3